MSTYFFKNCHIKDDGNAKIIIGNSDDESFELTVCLTSDVIIDLLKVKKGNRKNGK